MNDASLLGGVVRAMGLLVLSRDAGGGFAWVGELPAWAEGFGCSGDAPCDPASSFAFLEFFLSEAEAAGVWADGGPEKLASEAWSEPDRRGVDHQLEAVALRVGGVGVLVVEGVGVDFVQSQGILQTARERRLAMDRELAVRQLVEDQLRQRVEQRTAELNQSNEQLRSLASQVALAEQRERHRLAIGLHDHIGQLLAVAKMQLSAERAKAQDDAARDRLSDTLKLLEDAIAATRSLTFELSPPMLYQLGLIPTLASLVEQTDERHADLTCRFEDDGAEKALPDDIEVLLFQVVRELITNTLKHAEARRLDVNTHGDGGAVVVTVADDGKGFDPATLDRPVVGQGGFGLLSVRERLAHFGATLRVESTPGTGTAVRIVVPRQSG